MKKLILIIAVGLTLGCAERPYEETESKVPVIFSATSDDRLHALQSMIESGVDVNLNHHGLSPLRNAMLSGELEAALMLVEYGATPMKSDGSNDMLAYCDGAEDIVVLQNLYELGGKISLDTLLISDLSLGNALVGGWATDSYIYNLEEDRSCTLIFEQHDVVISGEWKVERNKDGNECNLEL